MPRKQSLLYDRISYVMCKNTCDGYICDTCEYKLTNEDLLQEISLKELISLIQSIIICEKSETTGIDPTSILISCRGAIKYNTIPISSNVKLSTNLELSKCIINMWVSVSMFAKDHTIITIIQSFRSTMSRCNTYIDLANNIQSIIENYMSWSTGIIFMS
jgi:ferredoxin